MDPAHHHHQRRPTTAVAASHHGSNITLTSNRLPPPPVHSSAQPSNSQGGFQPPFSSSCSSAPPSLSMRLPPPPQAPRIDPALRSGGAPQSLVFALPPALCISKKQRLQAEFCNLHSAELVKFWSQRFVEGEKVPLDVCERFELRLASVKRVMRAAVSNLEVVEGRGELIQFSDQAVKVMARACETFCKDVAKRGQLVLESKGKYRLGGPTILKAIESTDYLDFLGDVTACARLARARRMARKRGRGSGMSSDKGWERDDLVDDDDYDDDDDSDEEEEESGEEEGGGEEDQGKDDGDA